MTPKELADSLAALFSRLTGVSAQLAKAETEIAKYPVPRTDHSIPAAWYVDPGFVALWGRK